MSEQVASMEHRTLKCYRNRLNKCKLDVPCSLGVVFEDRCKLISENVFFVKKFWICWSGELLSDSQVWICYMVFVLSNCRTIYPWDSSGNIVTLYKVNILRKMSPSLHLLAHSRSTVLRPTYSLTRSGNSYSRNKRSDLECHVFLPYVSVIKNTWSHTSSPAHILMARVCANTKTASFLRNSRLRPSGVLRSE